MRRLCYRCKRNAGKRWHWCITFAIVGDEAVPCECQCRVSRTFRRRTAVFMDTNDVLMRRLSDS